MTTLSVSEVSAQESTSINPLLALPHNRVAVFLSGAPSWRENLTREISGASDFLLQDRTLHQCSVLSVQAPLSGNRHYGTFGGLLGLDQTQLPRQSVVIRDTRVWIHPLIQILHIAGINGHFLVVARTYHLTMADIIGPLGATE
jgi:hypothetical protein